MAGRGVILETAKVAIRRRITDLFNDASKGERPILRRADALFATDSVAWRVNGDVVTMMIGGVSGLLLQMLHPAVLAGVWDHSDFRSDMHGRLRRTAKFIAVTTYDHAEYGIAAIDRVRGIHDRIGGVLPDGTPYRVSDPALLAWVHVTEAISFLNGWIRYAEPDMPLADQDRYFVEMAVVAERLGADPVPRDRASAEALNSSWVMSMPVCAMAPAAPSKQARIRAFFMALLQGQDAHAPVAGGLRVGRLEQLRIAFSHGLQPVLGDPRLVQEGEHCIGASAR